MINIQAEIIKNAYLYFLVLIKNINGGGSWNITPMPNTDVCVQVLRTIESHGGRGFGNTGNVLKLKQINL